MALVGLIVGLGLAIAQQTPAPDPAAWWSHKAPLPAPALDPLAGRRLPKDARPALVDNGVDPLLYRLWGLQPLQSQILRRGEMIVEAWARPSGGVRQTVIRITLRDDGRGFVQARAGLGCCTPEIGRRIDVNAELQSAALPYLKPLASAVAWSQPRAVTVDYGGDTVSAVCVDGVSWDVTLVIQDQARHLRRACDDAEIGSIAPILAPLVSAALGHDPRLDVALPSGADFSRQSAAYAALIKSGGRLKDGEFVPPPAAFNETGADHSTPPPPSGPAVPATAPRP